MRLALALSPVMLALSCSDSSFKVVNSVPSAEIVVPVAYSTYVQQEDVLSFRGQVSDSNQDEASLSVVWLSDTDGVLWSDPPGDDGVTEFEIDASDLSLGEHGVTLTVTDREGESATDMVGVFIEPANNAPQVSIDEPADGDQFDYGTAITFVGSASDERDAGEDLAYEWDSDLYGVLDDGNLSGDGESSFTTDELDEGEHTLTFRVTDTDGNSNETSVQIEVVHVNEDPVAEITAPDSGASYRANWTVSFVGEVGDFEDDAEDLLVGWSSDLDGELYSGHPDSSGTTTFSLTDMTVGTHAITLTVEDGGGATATSTISLQIDERNSAPEAPEIELYPDDPTTLDDLVVYVTTDAVDPDGDAVSYAYQWYRDGVLEAALTSREVASDETVKNEEWTVVVTPTDGEEDGEPASAVVVILNSAPSITGVSISPSAPYAADTLSCTPTGWSDDDGDAEGYSYVWTVDGSVSSSTGSELAGAFAAGQDVSCTATPDDGEDTGTARSSSTVTIGNYAPTAPEIEISPTAPDTLDDLVVSISAASTDDDGDTVTYSYQWYRDSSLMSGYTATTVAAALTSKGEVWMVEVTPTDGIDEGDPATASVTILNTPPTFSAVWVSPSDPTPASTLSCVASGWSDDDLDSEGYSYAWTIDGVDSGTATSTLAGAFTRGQEVGCTATADDGEDSGTSLTSDAVTILNTPPTAPVVSIDPEYPLTGDDLVVLELTAASDDDGDSLSTTYEWTVDGVVSTETSDTVGSADTSIEEIWSVVVTVSDGEDTASSDPVQVRIWPGESDIIVTEIMPDPDSVSDTNGEYLEITNTTSVDIDLSGHWLADDPTDYAEYITLEGFVLPAGETFVACVNDDPSLNGGVETCDLDYSLPYATCGSDTCMRLGNTSDNIYVVNRAGTLDRLSYTTAWVTPGEAFGLDPGRYDSTSNDDVASWCEQTTEIAAGGDLGTPGALNDDCP